MSFGILLKSISVSFRCQLRIHVSFGHLARRYASVWVHNYSFVLICSATIDLRIGFCLFSDTNVSSGDNILGTPSLRSPLIICSLKYSTGSFPFIIRFVTGLYCSTATLCNCIKSLSDDTIRLFVSSWDSLYQDSYDIISLSSMYIYHLIWKILFDLIS